VFTADHYNMFFEACVPIFASGVAESAAGASDYPQLPRFGLGEAGGHLEEAPVEVGLAECASGTCIVANAWMRSVAAMSPVAHVNVSNDRSPRFAAPP
jgi:hypothetical protein